MFIYRTTEMPTLQKLLELERIWAIDGAGVNQPVGQGRVTACVVGECLQGPFAPYLVVGGNDPLNIFVGTASRFNLLSQSGVDPTSALQDGSGVTFDGNLWAELKGKTFACLVIQRVDCDMVAADSSVVKAFVKFDVVVNAADVTAGVTNKDIVIPSGQRFANAAIGSATKIIATSQQVTIPAGTTVAAGAVTCGFNFTQDLATGALTYVASGATIGVTAFFVKGTKATTGGSDLIDTAIDTALPSVLSVVGGTVSTIIASGSANDVFAPAGGGAQGSMGLSDCITANYAAAINKTMPGVDATNDIVAIWSARNYQMIATGAAKNLRAALWNNAVNASRIGRGRVACVTAAPALGTSPTQASTAMGIYQGLISADGYAASNPDLDRLWLSGPFEQVFSQELNADITISVCGKRAAMKVSLANNGKSEYQTSVGNPENAAIQGGDALEACFAANPLQDTDFVTMRAKGVAWLVKDRTAGWWFYSGVTGADPILNANRVADNRRSFADEVQDFEFALAAPNSKKPGTPARADGFVTDLTAYLEGLVNPPVGDSRAMAYQVLDGAAAGNTDYLNSHGAYLFTSNVKMYGDMNDIIINTMIGPTVIIAQVAPAA